MLFWNPLKKKKALKESTILILGTKWPLRTSQIHRYLKKNYNLSPSYQAVHKAIIELHKNEVIIKVEDGWQLSFDWIKNTHNLFHRLKDSYEGNLAIDHLAAEGNILTLNFKTIIELDKFYYDLFNDTIPNLRKKRIVFSLTHNWRPLLYPQKENSTIKKCQKEIYFLTKGSTRLDEWCSKFEKKAGAITKIKSGDHSSYDTYVIGDLIIQVYFPKEVLEKINYLFSYSKKETIDVNKIMHEIFEKKCKIVVIINRNDELAKQIRHQIIDLF